MLNLLTNYREVRQSTEGELGIQAPTAIGGNAKQHVKKLNNLPRQISQKSLLVEKELASREANTVTLLKQLVEVRKARMAAAVASHAAVADHRLHVMDTAEKLAATDANFASKNMLHGLTMGSQEAELNGMQRAFNGARTLVRG